MTHDPLTPPDDAKLRAAVVQKYPAMVRPILAMAQHRVRQLLGMDLVQALDPAPDKMGAHSKGPIVRKANRWFSVTTVDLSCFAAQPEMLPPGPLSPARRGLLICVAAFAILKGGTILESVLYDELKTMDSSIVVPGAGGSASASAGRPHDEFGAPFATVMDDFVKANYLKKVSFTEDNGACVFVF